MSCSYSRLVSVVFLDLVVVLIDGNVHILEIVAYMCNNKRKINNYCFYSHSSVLFLSFDPHIVLRALAYGVRCDSDARHCPSGHLFPHVGK